jgi:L-arabinokinase
MYRIVQGTTHGLHDAALFVDLINTLEQNEVPEARTLFDPQKKVIITRAPGRLDVMGGIADYSGSLVLQLPLKEATLAALQLAPDRRLRIVSLGAKEKGRAPHFEMNLDDFEKAGSPLDYQTAQKYFQRNDRSCDSDQAGRRLSRRQANGSSHL